MECNRKLSLMIMLLFAIPLIAGQGLVEGLLGESEAEGILEKEAVMIPEILKLDSVKIDSFLKQEAENFLDGRIPLIVHYNSYSQIERGELVELGGTIKYEYNIIDAVALSIDTIQLDKLAELSFVKKVELDSKTKVVLAQSTTQIGVSRVWLSHGVEGEGVRIAILDTGIDNSHVDVKNVVLEQDFTGEGTDDDHGHGTHVASIAGGTGAMSGGANKGVAPKASLMDIKVLNRLGTGQISDTIAGIQYAVVNNADIISMSLGAEIPCNGLDAASLASDAAVRQGVHVVVAAGNTGPLPGTVGSPGCAREVITVGAVDRLDNIAIFSSRGPTLDGRTKPDIVAPGVLILAAQAGGTYTAKSGTSMATPHVSGVIALIISQNENLSPSQIKEVLKNTAVDLGEDKNSQGNGRVSAYEAFIEATGLEPEEPPEETDDEEKREQAEKKARDEEDLDEVKKIRDKKEDGKDYYVVDGTRKDDNDNEERVWVYVNRDTLEIDKVTVIGFLKKILLWITDLFDVFLA